MIAAALFLASLVTVEPDADGYPGCYLVFGNSVVATWASDGGICVFSKKGIL